MKIKFYCVQMCLTMSQSLVPMTKSIFYSAFFTEIWSRMTWRLKKKKKKCSCWPYLLQPPEISLHNSKLKVCWSFWNILSTLGSQHAASTCCYYNLPRICFGHITLCIYSFCLSALWYLWTLSHYTKHYLIYGHSRRHTTVWPHLTIILTPATLSQFESYYSRKEGRDE